MTIELCRTNTTWKNNVNGLHLQEVKAMVEVKEHFPNCDDFLTTSKEREVGDLWTSAGKHRAFYCD